MTHPQKHILEPKMGANVSHLLSLSLLIQKRVLMWNAAVS